MSGSANPITAIAIVFYFQFRKSPLVLSCLILQKLYLRTNFAQISIGLSFSFPGLLIMCFVIGNDAGGTIWGTLFYHIGTQFALITFAVVTGLVMASLIVYVNFSKKASEYEKLSQNDDDCDDD